jgi:Zn-dependent protease with chaperone function
LKTKLLGSFEDFGNIPLIKEIADIWAIPFEKIKITIYHGSDSNTAFRKVAFTVTDLYIGDQFLINTDEDELKFALSHEIAHSRILKYSLYSIIFPITNVFFCALICLILVSSGIFSIFSFYILTLILYVTGIVVSNYFSWKTEYKADELGFTKTGNLNAAISFFQKYSNFQNNYGQVLNLIFNDHPHPDDRIKHLKNIDLQRIS